MTEPLTGHKSHVQFRHLVFEVLLGFPDGDENLGLGQRGENVGRKNKLLGVMGRLMELML